jgi:hypothetical protein
MLRQVRLELDERQITAYLDGHTRPPGAGRSLRAIAPAVFQSSESRRCRTEPDGCQYVITSIHGGIRPSRRGPAIARTGSDGEASLRV